ncbi:MAG: HAD-IB family hydrolase [Actinomycetota bacterium]
MPEAAAVFDLDRTLLLGASGPVITESMRARGLVPEDRLGIGKLLFGIFDVVGETLPSIALTRQGVRATRGWDRRKVQDVGHEVAPILVDRVEPFARQTIEQHRAAGRKLVLATTTPYDVIAPFGEQLGFDAVIATRYQEGADGRYTGRIDGEFVWSTGKERSVRVWARANRVDLIDSYAYSDSVFDLPLLSAVGNPVAVNPDARLLVIARRRGWPTVWFNAPPGVPKPIGVEPQNVLGLLAQPELFPWIDLDLGDLDRIPAEGGALLASNHRSYLDPLVVGFAAAQGDRPIRFLAKKEVTDAPVVGSIATALGAIRVDRGGDTAAAFAQAEDALRAGELLAVFPQGTIPRGEAFFDPQLTGRAGAVRLALATGTPLVPVGVWGTERAWPRNAKLPYLMNLAEPPTVRLRVGDPYHPDGDDLDALTAELMARIVDLLPAEAREHREPTPEELARTMPPGKNQG